MLSFSRACHAMPPSIIIPFRLTGMAGEGCAMSSHEQFELFQAPTEKDLLRVTSFLNAAGNVPVRVVVTRNRVTMISIAFENDGSAVVRMHEQFLHAPPSVIRALRTYIRTRRRASWATVSDFAQGIVATPVDRPRRATLKTRGRVYDLKDIAKGVNDEFFGGRISYNIGWGRTRPRKTRGRGRSIRYGSWNASHRTIRIHPLLDDSEVPFEFVRYIVFHEMLHALVPSSKRNGRRLDHPQEFRLLERSFPEVERMHHLAKILVNRLLD